MISVIIVAPGRPCEVRDVEPTLEVFQGIVGGYVERVALSGDTYAYVNEEGSRLRLPECRRVPETCRSSFRDRVVRGTFVVFADGAEECSLPPRRIQDWIDWFDGEEAKP